MQNEIKGGIMATYISYDDKQEKLLSLPIGKVRELLAYADGDETLDDWLDDIIPALLDSEWDDEDDDEWDEDYQEDDEEEDTDDEDWDDEDEDYEVEDDEEEEDWEEYVLDGEAELADPEEEQLAQDIAGDIAWGKYALSDIPANIYSQEVMDRIRYLI